MLNSAASIANAGALAWVGQSGDFDETTSARTGVGAITLNTIASRGFDAAQSLIFATKRGALAGADLYSVGDAAASDTSKQISTVEEGAGGIASVLADFDVDLLTVGIGRKPLSIVGMGHVDTGVGPTWNWGCGLIHANAAIVRNAAGDYTITMPHGIAAADCEIIVIPDGPASANLFSASVVHVSATTKRITIAADASPSILTDMHFAVVIVANGAGPSCARIRAAAQVAPGAPPTYTWQFGFDGDVAITRTGIGNDVVLTLANGNNVDGLPATGSIAMIRPRGAVGANGLVSAYAAAQAGGATVECNTSQEGAGGAVGAYADLGFDLLVLEAK